jgi:hypothetical protein
MLLQLYLIFLNEQNIYVHGLAAWPYYPFIVARNGVNTPYIIFEQFSTQWPQNNVDLRGPRALRSRSIRWLEPD